MSEPLTFPGNYKITRATLYPTNVSEQKSAIEIRSYIVNMSIVESMLNDSIRGTARLVDRGGLLEGYPIRGEEMLYIDTMDALDNRREYRFFVYKIDNLDITDSCDGVDYNIHFVSYQRFLADQKRIVAPYNQPISEIVQEIFNVNMRTASYGVMASKKQDTNKQITVEQTEGPIKVIIPRLTPIQAIKMLESRAFSSSSPTCSFRFFETADCFYFVTDEYMYRKAASESKIYPMSHSPNIPQDNRFLLARMSNLESIRNVDRVDTFGDIHNGAYKNKVLVLDIVNRIANIVEPGYDYNLQRGSYFAGYQLQLDVADRHSDQFISNVFTDENSRQMIMVKDYVEEDTGQLRGEQYLPQIASNRLAYFTQINSIRLEASGPGRYDITCGDFLELKIPELTYAQQKREVNTQLSGIYMVESVTRVIHGEEYRNVYQLIKRSWATKMSPQETAYLEPGEPGVKIA